MKKKKKKTAYRRMRFYTALALAVLPVSTVLLRSTAPTQTREWGIVGSAANDMLALASRHQAFYRDQGRFATIAELESLGVPVPEVTAAIGGNPRYRTPVTFFDERASADGYTVSARVEELPWVRLTIRVDPQSTDYSSSVDWALDAREVSDVVLWGFGIGGLLLGIIGYVTWPRGWPVRSVFVALALIALIRFGMAVHLAGLTRGDDERAPQMGDSIWSVY